MAEILGAVASGVALVEVATKAAGTVLKLQQLWREVKNVPETIANLMMHIECLDPAIWEAETHFSHASLSPHLWNDTAARKSTQCCRLALQRLSDLVRDLNAHIDSAKRRHKGIAFVKVMLRKDELRALERRLETAMSMLQLAQNGYMIALLKPQQKWIATKCFAEFQLYQATTPTTSLQPHSQTDGPIGNNNPVAGNIPMNRRYKTVDVKPSSQEWVASFQIPWWVWGARRAFEFVAEKSYTGWNFNLRVYPVRPQYAPVFVAAMRGDVKTMERLFDNGEASPFDRDEWGHTLAHVSTLDEFWVWNVAVVNPTTSSQYSAMHISTETFRLLADVGVFVNEMNDTVQSVLSYLGVCPSSDVGDLEKYSDVVGVLDRGGNWDLFRRLRPLSCPDHLQTPMGSRLDRMFALQSPDVRVIKDMIGPSWGEEADWICNASERSGVSDHPLIHTMAKNVAYHIFPHPGVQDAESSTLADSSELATEVNRRTDDIHVLRAIGTETTSFTRGHIPIGLGSPLVHLVLELQRRCWSEVRRTKVERLTRTGLLHWVRITKEAGIDVFTYGQEENETLMQPRMARTIYLWHSSQPRSTQDDPGSWYSVHYQLRWYLYGFKIGPELEDWQVLWNEPTDDFLEDFWALVEDRPPDIPGSWVE
ncbi:hypothetical protein PG993_008598 [Apiospora rasikravindrae]|uniref:Uncharacterized protein n=1 Tax=Apiospora rasikravindrae TaxID=990691 RepID=A0ABR1T0S7_9PEZI